VVTPPARDGSGQSKTLSRGWPRFALARAVAQKHFRHIFQTFGKIREEFNGDFALVPTRRKMRASITQRCGSALNLPESPG